MRCAPDQLRLASSLGTPYKLVISPLPATDNSCAAMPQVTKQKSVQKLIGFSAPPRSFALALLRQVLKRTLVGNARAGCLAIRPTSFLYLTSRSRHIANCAQGRAAGGRTGTLEEGNSLLLPVSGVDSSWQWNWCGVQVSRRSLSTPPTMAKKKLLSTVREPWEKGSHRGGCGANGKTNWPPDG